MLFAEKYEKYFGRSLFIKRKFLSVLLALSLALSLLPTAALAEEAPADESDDKPAVETVAEPRETEDEAVPQEANGEVVLVAQAEKTISTSEELVNAINNASDGDTITVSGEIAIDAPLVINKQTEAVYQTDTPPLLSFWNLFLTIYASQSQPLRDYKALH